MARNYWLTVASTSCTLNNCFESISFFQIPVFAGSRDFLFRQITLPKRKM